jgi:hypothetical protein
MPRIRTVKKPHKQTTPKSNISTFVKRIWRKMTRYWSQGRWWRKATILLVGILVAYVSFMYVTAQIYIASRANQPLRYGVTFIAPYARHFDLDPKDTLQAMIDELGIKQFRLVSYWNIHEREQGVYDFEDLDWQFAMAEEADAKVSLAIGLRQPRWPECHMPEWAEQMPMSEWQEHLKDYMGVVIDRYKDSPVLESYQLENEFFLDVFGICPDHSRERLIDEFEYVRQKDPTKPIIVSRSNNALGIPINEPRPDISAVSVYKRVWDTTLTKRYFEYPFPAWFYAHLAAMGELFIDRDMIIHELQAEAWLPQGFSMNNVEDIEEQNKSMNAERLKSRIEYGRATGIKEIYLWGAEWWYWRKVHADDPSMWDVAKEEIARAIAQEAENN